MINYTELLHSTIAYLPTTFLACLLGVFTIELMSNDIFRSMKKTHKKKNTKQIKHIRIGVVILVSVGMTFIDLGVYEYLITEMNVGISLFVGILSGLTGFKLFNTILTKPGVIFSLIGRDVIGKAIERAGEIEEEESKEDTETEVT